MALVIEGGFYGAGHLDLSAAMLVADGAAGEHARGGEEVVELGSFFSCVSAVGFEMAGADDTHVDDSWASEQIAKLILSQSLRRDAFGIEVRVHLADVHGHLSKRAPEPTQAESCTWMPLLDPHHSIVAEPAMFL